MDKYYYKNKLMGIRITNIQKGSIPQTKGKEPVQLVTLKHPQGTYLQSHMHRPRKRVTNKLQECMIVRRGKVRIDLYGTDKKKFKYIFLKEGQIYISMHGGVGIHILEDTEILEVKNGPFKEDKVII